jgi:hypothetical protein
VKDYVEAIPPTGPGAKTGGRCLICGQEFNRLAHARRHIESVHMPKKQECKICFATLKNADVMYHHMRKVHGDRKKSQDEDSAVDAVIEQILAKKIGKK